MNAIGWFLCAGTLAVEQAVVFGYYRPLPAAQLLPERAAGDSLVLSVRCGAWLSDNLEFRNASQQLCAGQELRGSFDEIARALAALEVRLRSAFDGPTQQSMQFRLQSDAGTVSSAQLDLRCFGSLPLSLRSSQVVVDTRKAGEKLVASVDAEFARWFSPERFTVQIKPLAPGLSALFRGAELYLVSADAEQAFSSEVAWLQVQDPVSRLTSGPFAISTHFPWAAAGGQAPSYSFWVNAAVALLLASALLGLLAAAGLRQLRRTRSPSKPAQSAAASTRAESCSASSIVNWNRQLLARRRCVAGQPCLLAASVGPAPPHDFDNLSEIALDESLPDDRSCFAEEFKV